MATRFVLVSAVSLAGVHAAMECFVPTALIKPSPYFSWSFQDPYILDPEAPNPAEPNKCYGRYKEDTETFGACKTACDSFNNEAGVTNAKIACMKNPTVIGTFQQIVLSLTTASLLSGAFAWSNLVRTSPSDDWEALSSTGGTCPTNTLNWGTGLEDGTQLSWQGSAGAVGLTNDKAVVVFGEKADGMGFGDSPYLAGVNGDDPNPSDVFCFCEWDPVDTTLSSSSSSVDTSAFDKMASDAVAGGLALAGGLIAVAVIVPIVGLILLIVCIVCLCKQCNKQPSA